MGKGVGGSSARAWEFDRFVRYLAGASAGAAGALAVFVLAMWLVGDWRLGTLGPDYVPMAPSTAVLVLLLSVAVFLRRALSMRDQGRLVAWVAVAAAMGDAATSILRHALAFWHPTVESAVDGMVAATFGVSLGRLSPFTIAVLVLTGMALFSDLRPAVSGSPWRHIGPLSAVVGCIMAGLVIISYAVGAPVLYGTDATPMALPTSICLALTNLALLLESSTGAWPVSSLRVGHRYSEMLVPPRFLPAFFGLSLFLLAAIAAVGILYLWQQQDAMRRSAQNELLSVVEAQSSQIATWHGERMDDARFFMEVPFVAREVGNYAAGLAGGAGALSDFKWMEVFAEAGRYERIALFGPGGKLWVSVPWTDSAPDNYLDEMVAKVFREGRILMTDLRMEGGQAGHVDFLAPVLGGRGSGDAEAPGVLAVVLLRVDAHRLVTPLVRSWASADFAVKTLLVRREAGDMLVLNQPDPASVQFSEVRRVVTASDVPGSMAVRGEAGIAEGADYDGVPVVAAVRPIPGTPWAVVAQTDQPRIYARSRQQMVQVAIILFLLILATGLSVGILWRQRNLMFFHEALALERERRTLAQRFEHLMRQASDIILLADQTGGIREANDRAVDSYGYSLSALRKMRLSDLSMPGAGGNAPRRGERSTATGTTLYETVHRRADGSTFSAEVSGSVVDIGGDPFMLVMVRDISERERAAEALRASEQNLRALFDSIQDFLFVVNLHGDLLQVNHTVVARLGYTRDELLGKNILFLHPPEWREEAGHILHDIFVGRANTCGAPLQTRSGTVIPVETHVVGGVWSGQEVLFGVSRDISELRASEEKFVRVFRNNPTLMAISSLNEGRFQEVNDAFLQTLGFEREEVIGKTSMELHLFVDPEQREVMRRAVLEDDVLHDYEVTVRRKDGQFRYGLFSAELIRVQDETVLLTVMNDVTERKRAEKSLARIRKAVDSTSEAIGISDPAGVHFYQNAAFTQLFGYRVDELRAPLGAIKVYADRDVAREVFATMMRGDSWKGETIMVSKDGRRFPVALRADAIKDDEGTLIGLVGVHTDVSDLRRAVEERQRLLEQTQRDAQTKAELLAEVNHRVKNNLTAILGLLLGEKQYAPPRIRPHVAPVLDSIALRIRGLLQVHQMLSDTQWAPMRLSELADRVIRGALVALPRERRIGLTVTPSPVEISPRQAGNMALVLNELAVNTVKHATGARTEIGIHVLVYADGATVCLEYRDDGPGYPEEVLGGTGGGVGMHLVRQLVTETLRGSLVLSNGGGAVAEMRIKREDVRQT